MRYTGAQARALRIRATEQTTDSGERQHAKMRLRQAASDLAATVEALEAERDEARRSLDDVREAIGNGADEDAWPPGTTVPQAVAKLVSRVYRAEETCALLYGDVDAQHRVISDACALLGVCDDSEDDWPKLPVYVERVRDDAKDSAARVAALEAELAEARLCLLAEAGDPRGAEGLHPGWVHRAVGWCLVAGRTPTVDAAVRRGGHTMGEGPERIRWTRDLLDPCWPCVPAGLTIRDAMRWVEREVGL